jgi:hypothetical protein
VIRTHTPPRRSGCRLTTSPTSPTFPQCARSSQQAWCRVFRPGVRTFSTGATRDTDEGKLDFEGFLSPTVLKAFAEYMHEKRKMPDGSLRDSDNWQRGIPVDAYMKSMWRHFSPHQRPSRPRGHHAPGAPCVGRVVG